MVLDSAVAYVMDKVDFVLVGSEAVVESGGLINAVGSNQMAIIAKAQNKPFYALAERWIPTWRYVSRSSDQATFSYKFHRLFPLSQYDLPTHHSGILSFAHPTNWRASEPAQSTKASPQRTMSSEQMDRNPDVDYTTWLRSSADYPQSDDDRRPDLISLVFSDVGVLTPGGVSQYLVGMFAGL
jgi:translation initiation factor eIF-2B subunit alpha